MQDRTPWLALLGGMWLLLGLGGLLWAASGLLPASLDVLLPLPPFAQSLVSAFRLPPWSQASLGLVSLFAVVTGWGLLRRKGWLQTILVPAHLLAIVYAGVGAIGVYVGRDRLGDGWANALLFLLGAIMANALLAAWMNSVQSTEALTWMSLRTVPVVPARCEFCGSLLDPDTGLCPQCKSIPQIVHRYVNAPPPRAKLISLTDETEHWIEPGRRTVIGRGLSSNDINVDNPTVSRQHAQIEYVEGHYVITALQDYNGTFVNDALIRQRTLQDGDELRFGRARYRFTILKPDRSRVPC